MVVGIIGAGASGMAAALTAAENPNTQVILFERQARVGRKLSATGNGRCNLSNIHAGEKGYHGTDPLFAKPALTAFSPADTLNWFRSIGLFTVTEATGKVYPYSDQANSVVDVLRLSLEKPNILLKTGFEVKKTAKSESHFIIESDDDSFLCDKLIVACGGLAGSKLGGSMSGYKLLSRMGHKSTRLRPALVQIKTSWNGVGSLKGVRANVHIQIFKDDVLFQESAGEIQFTEMGISGPVVFEISRDVCSTPGKWIAQLDFLPDYTAESLKSELERRKNSALPMDELLTGILHNRLGRTLTRDAGIRGKLYAREIGSQELEDVIISVKNFSIALTAPLGMDSAQVTAGGVLTEQFDPLTMESRIVPGLYACGEVLDIDGDCGGYNLQWAWSSGRNAGLHAGRG